MTKILVVDDEPDLEALIRQKFRKKIRNQEYEFLFAENGRAALDTIEDNPDIDMVMSDINMPVMDGLTMLTELNEKSPLIKAIIVSAYGDMENIRTAMNRGAYDFVTKPINFDDLTLTMEKTIKHARHLKETIQAIKDNNILKMYVDENVLNFMNSREYESAITANETIEATVMFVDIVGFTRISENLPPNTVVKMINTYFEVMVCEIIEHDGLIDKFIGDAIMAVFKCENHLEKAVHAALAVRKKINNLKDIDGAINFKPMVSIGIKGGEMISGNIGSLSLKRLDYTVIGDTVNTAARLQDNAGANNISISEQEFTQIKEYFNCDKVGLIELKNKAKPIIVYHVVE